jgi:hypothetical protein
MKSLNDSAWAAGEVSTIGIFIDYAVRTNRYFDSL